MIKMKKVGSVSVDEIISENELYQRQLVNSFSAIWFIAENDSWVFVGESEQSKLEANWQAINKPEPWTEEERQEALCEQAASDDYENTFYAQ